MKLVNAIRSKFPNGLDYSNAVQLCCWIHVAKNSFPSDFEESAGDKSEIARAFAILATEGIIKNNGTCDENQIKITDFQHWISVLESLYNNLDHFTFDFDFINTFQ